MPLMGAVLSPLSLCMVSLSLSVASTVAASAVGATTRMAVYSGTAEMRSNPERGFRHELHPDENGTISPLQLSQLESFNLTVGQTYWYLPANPVLSEQTLQGVTKTLRTLRSVGVKSLFRFAYDRCNDGPIGENNYTAETILGHIQQVKQRFQAEIDVVYVLQAGFLGCWGEWHGSRNLSDKYGPARREIQQILHAELFDLLPMDRKMNLRYPGAKFDVVLHRDCAQIDPSDENGHRSNLQCGGYNTTAPTGELPAPSPEMAFGIATAANFKDNTAVARLGYDNDAFMCDQFGSGTWVGGAQHDGDVPRTSRMNPHTHQLDPRDGPNGQIPDSKSYADPIFNSEHGPMIDPGFDYEKMESPYVPMDNEMGWNVGLKRYPTDDNTSWPLKVPAEVAAWRLREMHYTTMSLMHGYSHLDGNGHGHQPAPNNNETIDFWMRTKLNVTMASRDFRLPISPEYARAGKTGCLLRPHDRVVARPSVLLYEYIRDHLGYRIELRSAVLPQQLDTGGVQQNLSFVFQAALVNWGFAAPISPRPVQLVLLSHRDDAVVWRSPSVADPRDWQPYVPGDPTYLPTLHRINAVELSIPASALQCEGGAPHCIFRFGMSLPDMRMEKAEVEGPHRGAAYCIRLANDNMPWVGGVNVLGEVNVTHSANE